MGVCLCCIWGGLDGDFFPDVLARFPWLAHRQVQVRDSEGFELGTTIVTREAVQ